MVPPFEVSVKPGPAQNVPVFLPPYKDVFKSGPPQPDPKFLRTLAEQPFKELLTGQFEMFGDIGKNG